MTLKEAARVLSERKHGGRSDWWIDRPLNKDLWVTVPGAEWRDYTLTPFEALAVAERYLTGTTPEEDAAAAEAEIGRDL